MRVVIVGAGVVGYNTAALLSREEHDIVLIDKDEAALVAARDQLDLMAYHGSGTNPEVLRQAGAGGADLFIAATMVDEVNMVSCFMAKQMGAHRTVARIRGAEMRTPLIVNGGREHKRVVRLKNLGIDYAITPEQVAAEEIARVVRRTCAIAVEEFGQGRVEMSELRITSAFPNAGHPLREVTFPRPCIVAGILRKERTLVPGGNDAIEVGDRVYIIAARESMGALAKAFGASDAVPRSAIILGGGRIGLRTARLLSGAGVRVKIIEQSIERSRQLAADLEGVLVIHGEGTDSSFLREEGIAEADGFVGTTGRDELNALVGLLAKKLGAKRTVIVANRPEYISLVEELGVDAAVNPLTLTANAILRFVRRGRIISVARLEGDGAEAIELEVPEGYRYAGRRLREADLPRGVLVGAVLRGDKILIPDGNTALQAEDRVVVICTPQAIAAVERHFASR